MAKGRAAEMVNRVDANDPANSVITVVLLKVVESDALLKDYATLAAILAGSNTECNFTNYARKELNDSVLTAPAPDNTNDRQDADIPDLTWTAAGGATNNNVVKLIICYDGDSTGGADSAIIPLSYHDFVITTNGGDLVAQIAAAGFFRAT